MAAMAMMMVMMIWQIDLTYIKSKRRQQHQQQHQTKIRFNGIFAIMIHSIHTEVIYICKKLLSDGFYFSFSSALRPLSPFARSISLRSLDLLVPNNKIHRNGYGCFEEDTRSIWIRLCKYVYHIIHSISIYLYAFPHPSPFCHTTHTHTVWVCWRVCVYSFVDLFKLIIMFALFIHIIFMQTRTHTYKTHIIN